MKKLCILLAVIMLSISCIGTYGSIIGFPKTGSEETLKNSETENTAQTQDTIEQEQQEKKEYDYSYSVQVTAGATNIRQAPNTSSAIIRSAIRGETFDYISTENGWYQMNYADDIAYMYAANCALIKNLFYEDSEQLDNYAAVIATSDVNIRREATVASAKIGTLGKGRALKLIDTYENWYKVSYDGRYGYISKHYSATVTTNSVIEKIIGAGMEKIGTAYLWGATRVFDNYGVYIPAFNGKSFDCSSFVQYCYYEGAGVILGTCTGSQAVNTVGSIIKKTADLTRGDIIFTGGGNISHVIIYLGANLIMHAYSAYGGPVSVTSFDRWKPSFITARHVDLTVRNQYGSW